MKAMEDKSLPTHAYSRLDQPRRAPAFFARFLALSLIAAFALFSFLPSITPHRKSATLPLHASEIQAKCRALSIKPGPPPNFHDRKVSDRYVEGTKPVLIMNATIWTGRLQGSEVLSGDILIAGGILRSVGQVDLALLSNDIQVINAQGAFVTPGIVDLHSHMGVIPSPSLSGANDGNSLKGPVLPWLRSLDGLNTHDASYELAVAGGVTTSLILPGSANAIGGQAFVIKHRQTSERSSTSLLLEPPFGLNGSAFGYDVPPRWKHMKHACGENPARTYSGTRMDTTWAFREAYDKARTIKKAQDAYCDKVLANDWADLGAFPDDFQWEPLVDVLRGRVKVHTHCYEAVDFDSFVRLTNEFQFPVAAFHHAHEAYLVADLLKKAYDHPPAVAMFAAFSHYKREAYRYSKHAPKILHDNGIKVIMKTDHPAILSRYLLHEAQQAHYYGLPAPAALTSVISNPAEVLGLDHRIGFVEEGYDADLVIWDSHPLSLGATPKQVFIDGVPQVANPYEVTKPSSSSSASPHTPNFDREAAAALKYDGLPPLRGDQVAELVMFTNLTTVWVRNGNNVQKAFEWNPSISESVVGVRNGEIVCMSQQECAWHSEDSVARGVIPKVIDLEHGAIQPGLVSFGAALGLQEIALEASTIDGPVLDPIVKDFPRILQDHGLIRAVDGLQYQTLDALMAYRAGVTTSISAPVYNSFLSGLSVKLSLGAAHKLEKGAVVKNVVALHVGIRMDGGVGTSTKIATLRRLLLGEVKGELGTWFKKAAEGSIRLVIDVESADIMATLLRLQTEVNAETTTGTGLKLTFVGATESHMLAKEIAAAGVGVIITPPRSFPYNWERRRIVPGPPLTPNDLVSYLISKGVTVGIGPQGIGEGASLNAWAVRNLRFDAGWIQAISSGLVSKAQALEMASTNIDILLGLDPNEHGQGDLVATKGGDLLGFEGKVVGVVRKERGVVDLFSDDI